MVLTHLRVWGNEVSISNTNNNDVCNYDPFRAELNYQLYYTWFHKTKAYFPLSICHIGFVPFI